MVGRMKLRDVLLCSGVCLFLSGGVLSPAVEAAGEGPPLLGADGEKVEVDGALSLAVVGNLRERVGAQDTAAGRLAPWKGVTESIVADIVSAEPDGVVLMGDAVRSGKKGEYKRLLKRAGALLDGSMRVMPVVGEHESMRDDRLAVWGSTFPGAGADIGFNRTASWYAVDVETDGYLYRLLVLDTNKQAMGSRWREQMAWLDDVALEGRYKGLLVFMHHSQLELAGAEPRMNDNEVAGEMLEIIEDQVGLGKLRAVFSADGHVSEVMLPDGPLGVLYVGAGGGGAPADDLSRWANGADAGRPGDVNLHVLYDVAILKALDYWADDHEVPQLVLDQAKAENSFEGFRPVISARHMPTYGWFRLTLEGEAIQVDFRHHLPDGTLQDRYAIHYSGDNGWIPGKR